MVKSCGNTMGMLIMITFIPIVMLGMGITTVVIPCDWEYSL